VWFVCVCFKFRVLRNPFPFLVCFHSTKRGVLAEVAKLPCVVPRTPHNTNDQRFFLLFFSNLFPRVMIKEVSVLLRDFDGLIRDHASGIVVGDLVEAR